MENCLANKNNSTKITDPPPKPEESEGFAASQQQWTNKHEFLNVNLKELDAQVRHTSATQGSSASETVQTTSSGIPSGPPPPYTEMRSRQ